MLPVIIGSGVRYGHRRLLPPKKAIYVIKFYKNIIYDRVMFKQVLLAFVTIYINKFNLFYGRLRQPPNTVSDPSVLIMLI